MKVLENAPQKSLSFSPDALRDPDFNPQAFIAQLRTHAPLRVVRDDLRTHIASLQHQTVTILQNNFQTFSTLNTTISDADTLAESAQLPLANLRVMLSALLEDLDTQINSLDQTLALRRSIKETKSSLQTLLQANELLQKCERLLREYSSLPKLSTESLRLAERIASESARLSFVLSRATEGAFLTNLSVRISALRRGVRNCMDQWFRRALFPPSGNSYDADTLQRVLSMYVVAGLSAEAESFFRKEVVATFTNARIRMTTMLTAAERKKSTGVTAADALQAAEEEIINFLGEKVTPLISLCESEERLNSKLDFVGRSVWPQVERSISSSMTAAFSPGIPDVFHQSLLAGYRIYAAIEAATSDPEYKNALRTSKATVDFWKHWNLPVYFQLRFQEITTAFDKCLAGGPTSVKKSNAYESVGSGNGSTLLRTDLYRATPTACLVASLRRCWSEDVFLPSLAHRFLRLSLQLLARYSTWVRTGLAGEWSESDAIPSGAARIFHDITVLRTRTPAEMASVLRLRARDLDSEMLENLDSVFSSAVEAFAALLPELSRSIGDALVRACVENLQPLRGILATYRMSSKQAPSTHSSFVPKILRPLKKFMKDHEAGLESNELNSIGKCVVEETTSEYFKMATDLLQRNKSSEATLRRLNIGRSGALANAGSGTSSVIDKISTQLYLDVEKFSEEVRMLGISTETIESLGKLRDSVKREGQGDESPESEKIGSDIVSGDDVVDGSGGDKATEVSGDIDGDENVQE